MNGAADDKGRSYRTEIIVAVIGLVGVLGGAFFANWDKLTLKREGGRMQFFVNDGFVKEFNVPRFPVARIGLGAACRSKIEVTSIEGRVKD